MLQLIRQSLMSQRLLVLLLLFLFLVLFVEVHVALAAAPNVVISVAGIADREFGNHLRVVGWFARRTDMWRTDVAGTASTGRIGAIALVAVNAFTDYTAIDVGSGVGADIPLTSSAVRHDRFMFAHD